MPELTPREFAELIHKWQTERPESAVWPRIPSNPYGDNTVGMTFDEGWSACLDAGGLHSLARREGGRQWD